MSAASSEKIDIFTQSGLIKVDSAEDPRRLEGSQNNEYTVTYTINGRTHTSVISYGSACLVRAELKRVAALRGGSNASDSAR